MSKSNSLLLIGFGKVAFFVNEVAIDYNIKYATTRSKQNSDKISNLGLSPILLNGHELSSSALRQLADASIGADVLVSFPPDGVTDLKIANFLKESNKIVYISSTSVYGDRGGLIDDTTPVDSSYSLVTNRLEAEKIWSRVPGTVILRAPALYGPDYGLHKSLLEERFKIPGDGTRYSSRIHLKDLARIIISVFNSEVVKGTYVVGDEYPATYLEVVTWLCKELEIAIPSNVSIDEVHYTLRSDRQIDSSNLLGLLNLNLEFPDYKTGFKNCLKS